MSPSPHRLISLAVSFFATSILSLNAELVGYWKFDEISGTVANDQLGNHPGLIGTGVSIGRPGINGTAFEFDGSLNGKVEIGQATFLPAIVSSQTVSFCAWLKSTKTSASQSLIFIGDDTVADQYYSLGTNAGNGAARGILRSGNFTSAPGPSVTDGNWHHIAATITVSAGNKTIRTYVDGVLESTLTEADTAPTGLNDVEIGRLGRGGSGPTDLTLGLIDEVQIYDHLLTDAEVLSLFQNPGVAIGEVTAEPDSTILHHNSKVRLGVLDNDSGIFDQTSVEITSPPSFGTATVDHENGTILYTHTTGTPSSDLFSYRVESLVGGFSDPTTVTLNFSTALRIPNSTVKMPSTPPATSIGVENAFPGLTFDQPSTFASPPGDNHRLFIGQKNGLIWVIPDVTAASPTQLVYLDLRSRVESNEEENGLKGLAFHPDFLSNGRLFVSYVHETVPGGNKEDFFVRLSEFVAATPTSSTSLPGTSEIFHINQIFNPITGNTPRIHNIADCNFGPDGYLYLGIGDGDGHPDPSNHSQKINGDLWAGLLRIDVDKLSNLEPNPHPGIPTDSATGKARFSIPLDNPFVHTSLGGTWTGSYNGQPIADLSTVRSEYYATGLRNPWQFSWDNGELWLGDVGFNSREEINLIVSGANYGWVYYEGDIIRGGNYGQPPANVVFTPPLHQYNHGSGINEGNAVIGGYVYRGSRYPGLDGRFLYADFTSGNIWALERQLSAPPQIERIAGESGIVGFAPDPSNGDVLMLDIGDGVVRRLTTSLDDTTFPKTLSATGIFADLSDLSPNPGVVFYKPNLKFWSDHADKSRWFVISNLTDKFGYNRDAPWDYPVGTVWVKHFDLQLDRGNSASAKRLETRVFVRTADGSYGVSYKWNEEETEAFLVPDSGDTFELDITDGGTPSTQTWSIPSRAQCISCHNPQAGHALSFNTPQLNREGSIAGVHGNFLSLLKSSGYLDTLPESPNVLPRHVAPDDPEATSEAKARSYLAVNCAYCHQEGGTGGGNFDLRAYLSLDQTGIIDGESAQNGGNPVNKLIVRGHHNNSVIWNRAAAANGFTRMPPIGTNEIDFAGTAMLADWINNSLPSWQSYKEWRVANFGNETNPIGARDQNPDQDNSSNFLEYLAKTNPKQSSDNWDPNISFLADGIRFKNLPGAHLTLESSEDLRSWLPLDSEGNDGTPTNGAFRSLPHSYLDPNRFFRIRVSE